MAGRKKKVEPKEEGIKPEKETKVRKGKGGKRKLWCEVCQEPVLNEKGKCAKCGSNNYELGHELGKGDIFQN